MSKLSFVLRDSGVRRAIEAQESRLEILRQIGRAEQRLVTSNAENPIAVGGRFVARGFGLNGRSGRSTGGRDEDCSPLRRE